MDVVFITTDGRQLEMEVYYYDTVLEIKRSIEHVHGIPVDRQRLLVGNEGDEAMEDARDTDYYGIVEGSRIRLQVLDHGAGGSDQHTTAAAPESSGGLQHEKAAPESIMVTVRPRSSTMEATVWVDPQDDVEVLKGKLKKVSERLQISDDYFFIFGEHIMDDKRSFHWHGVQHGDVIDLFQHSD